MAVRMNMSRGQVRHGFNAVLLFSLLIACLHLYTLRQRMHQLEGKMTVMRHGGDVIRRSIFAENTSETTQVPNDPGKGLEDEIVDDPGKVLEDEIVDKSRSTRKPTQSSSLIIPGVHDKVILKNTSIAKDTTLAPTSESTKPPVQVNKTTAIQKPSPFPPTDPPNRIINPHNFSFVVNNPDKCGDQEVLLLILVATKAEAQVERETVRKTWGNEYNIAGVVIKTVFAVGHTDNMNAQKALEEENAKFKDIIQEDFVDSYHNLTLKTVMSWKWAFQYCPKARFVMKADDDTFVNIFSVVKHLIGMQKHAAKRYVTGWVYTDAKPVRDPMSQWNKWYVKYEDYPRDSYPKYPCGFAYVISNDITQALYETSETIKYLFLEDAFLGLCMEKLGIEPIHHGGFCPWYVHVDSCQFEWLMASHWVKRYEYMWYNWNNLRSC